MLYLPPHPPRARARSAGTTPSHPSDDPGIDEINFEKSFSRLENILEKMNSGAISLDDSLKLYEEADGLIHSCSDRLSTAEQKIETLIHKRNGDLKLDDDGQVLTETFTPPSSQ